MIAVTRQEVLAYLAAHGIDHVEDESNQTDAYLRNRLRHHVIPRLLSENPALLRSYAAASERMRQEDAFLNQQASEALARARQGAAIQCSALLAEPPVLQARAILLWLRHLERCRSLLCTSSFYCIADVMRYSSHRKSPVFCTPEMWGETWCGNTKKAMLAHRLKY